MELGFIGLGHLGKAVAGRLAQSGHTLTVWNRTASKAQGMPARTAATAKAAAEKAHIVFLCLFDSQAVQDVFVQENGLLSADLSGKIVVDLTTNHFRKVMDFYAICEKAGAVYLESPVLGSVVPASQGALTVLVSGSQVGYEKVKPVLEHIGKHIFYLKAPSLATKMKLINNLVLGSFMATLAEALAMGERVGMEKGTILEILSVGGGNSLVLNAKREKLLKEDFTAHFSNALIYKDLHCLQDLAYDLQKPLFSGATAKELFARTFEENIDREDFSAIYKLFKKG